VSEPTKRDLFDPKFWESESGTLTKKDLTNPNSWPSTDSSPKPNFVQKAFKSAFDTFTGALEPLALPLATVEAAAADAYALTTGGKVEELAQLWHALPAYAPFGAKPEVTISGSELLAKMGVDNEAVKQWGGLALDFVADPLLAAGWLNTVGKVSKAVGMAKEGDKLLSLAEKVQLMTSPRGAVEAFRKMAPGPTETMRNWLEKVWEVKIPAVHVVADEAKLPGFLQEDRSATVREVLFPKGVPPVGRRFEEGGSITPATWTGSDSVGTGIPAMAEGSRRKFQHLVSGTIQTLDELYRKADPQRGALYRQLDDVVGGFVRDPEYFPRKTRKDVVELLKKPPVRDKILSWTETQLQVASGQRTFQKRLEKLYRTFKPKVSFDEFVQTANKAAALTYATYIQAGYELSDYAGFLKLINQVADDKGLEADKILFHFIDAIRVGANPAKHSSAYLQQRQVVAVDRALKRYMKNAPQFSKLDPTIYMQNLLHGFVVPALGKYADPAVLQNLAENWDIVTFAKSASPKDLAATFARFGEKAPKIVADLVESSPYPVVRVDDIVEAFEANNLNIAKLEVKEALLDLNPDLLDMEQTLKQIGRLQKGLTTNDLLAARLKKQRGSTKLWYKLPSFTEEDLQTLYQLSGATKQLGAVGIKGSAEVRAKTLLEMAYNDLLDMDLIQPWGSTPRHYIGPVTFINIPKQPKTWGPLAGTSIPLWSAREILKVLQQPMQHRQALYQRLVNIMRKGYLSAPKTTARNIMSNLGLLHLGGIPVDEVVPYISRGRKMVQEYATRGWSRDLEGAEHMLSFLHDSSLAKWFREPAEDQLYTVLEGTFKKSRSFKDWIDKFDNLIDKMANTPPVGFLGAFQAAEDYTRGAVFLWARDKLLKEGADRAEAISKAAHIAVNSVYDYSSVGIGIDILRKSGLALFPAFTYFTTGRVARALYERPGNLVLAEKLITATNRTTVPKDDERDAVDKMTAHMDYLRNHPLLIPSKKKGHYFVVPLDYLLPQAAVTGGQLKDALAEPAFGGALRPVVDVITAWLNGTGEPTAATQKFGARVFEPYQTTVGKALSTAAFLGKQVAPGSIRDVLDFAQRRAGHYLTGGFADEIAHLMGRYLNAAPGQLLARYALGFSSYEVDTTGEVTIVGAQKAHDAWYREQLDRLNRARNLAALQGNDKELEALMLREQQITDEYLRRVETSAEGIR